MKNLSAFYDDNHITIDGDTNCSFTEDVGKRFESYNWNVLTVKNGDEDLSALWDAIVTDPLAMERPT